MDHTTDTPAADEFFEELPLPNAFWHHDVPVENVLRAELLECSPDAPLHRAAELMAERQCSSVLVVEGDVAVGIWTERDALAVDFSDPAAFGRAVGEVMSSPVRSVSADCSLHELAVRFQEEGVRHYLVVDGHGERCGIVSQTDVVVNQGIEHYLRLRKTRSVVRRLPLVVEEGLGIAEVARKMREYPTDAVVVEYGTGEHGILTERDVVRLVASRQGNAPVGPLASRPLIAIPAESSLYRARNLLLSSRVRHVAVTGAEGELLGLIGFTDILFGMEFAYLQELRTALQARDEALTVSRRSLRLAERIIECSPEGIMITDSHGIIQSVNPAFTRLTGYSSGEVVGRSPGLLSSGRHGPEFYHALWARLSAEGEWQGEIWNRRKNGEIFPELLTIAAITDTDESGEVTHYAALFSDITALKANEEQIRRMAYYDPLTGLPNRRLFSDRLAVAMAHAHRHRNRTAVVFVDLDRFKEINDSYGHITGDVLLQEIAKRLREAVREDDTVARLGGDEFVLLLADIGSADDAVGTARRIIEAMKEPIQLEGRALTVTASVGISFYPDDGDSIETLVQNADAAMYQAKSAGRNGYRLYSPALNSHTLQHLAMEMALRDALEQDQLVLHYQPLIESDSGRVVSLEALLRWRHPQLGLMAPADFLPLAEESGLIIPIGSWVVNRVVADLQQWDAEGVSGFDVAINLSRRQFAWDGLARSLTDAVGASTVPPSRLTLDVDEALLAEDFSRTLKTTHLLREAGVGIAMDDYGTGALPICDLKRLPLKALKLHRVLIREIASDETEAAVVAAVLQLAKALGLVAVAKGVESEPQRARLCAMGCHIMQGFCFGAPQPFSELSGMLRQGSGQMPLPCRCP